MEKRKRKPGGGRKPAALQRPIDRNRSFYLFADQVEQVTPDFVRQAVDTALRCPKCEILAELAPCDECYQKNESRPE